MTARAVYFGCLGEVGHYLHHDDGTRTLNNSEFPWWSLGLIDGGLLRNGKIADEQTGHVKWVCGGVPDPWHAFAWWDRSVDKRGASNSGFYVCGFGIHDRDAAFAFACSKWPEVIARQPSPLVLEPLRATY